MLESYLVRGGVPCQRRDMCGPPCGRRPGESPRPMRRCRMADPMTQAYDMTRAMQEEALKNSQLWSNWVDAFVVNPADPPMGMTPKDVVWKRGKIQLYRYH